MLLPLVSVFSLIYFTASIQNKVKKENEMDHIIKTANNEITFDISKKIMANEADKNFVFSPICLSQILSMLMLAAKKSTYSQLITTLKYNDIKQFNEPENVQQLQELIYESMKHLTSSSNTTLRIASGIFPQIDFPLNENFINDIKKYYKALAENVNYKTPKEAINTINQFTSKNTQGKIDNMLDMNSVDKSTKLVLTNAIYFKGLWEQKFDLQETSKLEFVQDDDAKFQVNMMMGDKQAFYATQNLTDHQIELEILQMNYQDDNHAMLILLPQQHAINKLAQVLTPALMDKLRTEGRRQKVAVAIPVFKIEYKSEPKTMLQQMGLTDIFSPNADLSGMVKSTSNPGLYVDEIYQKAYIDVNEAGTEAAAAVSAVVNLRSFQFKVRFLANRPFLYYILDKKSGIILFAGAYKNAVTSK